jgi:hypothetical protein
VSIMTERSRNDGRGKRRGTPWYYLPAVRNPGTQNCPKP